MNRSKMPMFILWPCFLLLASAGLMMTKNLTVTVRAQDRAGAIVWYDLSQSGSHNSDVGQAGGASLAAGSEELFVDDGTPEVALAGDGLIAVNRLTPSAYPATLQTIRIYFIPLQGSPNPAGAQIKLIAFAGASGTTSPPANPTLLVNQTVTIPTVPASGGFVEFPIQNGPVITGGDLYVGFQSPNPAGGVAFIADGNGTQRQRSFTSTDNGQSYTGPVTIPGGAPINLMIRAVVMNDAQPTPHISLPPVLNFGSSDIGVQQQQNLTVSNTGGAPLNITSVTSNNAQFSLAPTSFPLTIAPGAQAQLAVRFTPSSAGAQNGALTITSNDPIQPTVNVAVSGTGGASLGTTFFINSGTTVSGSVVAPPTGGAILLPTQFAIYVPAGATQLKIDLTGTQDVDLFARFNQRVAISAGGDLLADYGSINDGVTPETITVTPSSSPPLQAGLYYIAIGNFGPGASNFTLTATVTGGTAPGAVATTSAASFNGAEATPEMIVAFFGNNLATGTQSATAVPLPTSLLGTSVKVRDNAGVERLAPLFFVAPTQINAMIPAGTAAGRAHITITSGDGKVSVGTIPITGVSPGLFAANADGQGVAAAEALRVKADNSQSFEAVTRYDSVAGRFVAVPIDLGPASDQVFLVLYGTGIRGRSSLSAVTATIGGTAVQVGYAGQQGDFVGLDQVNLSIPRSLAGRGDVDVVLMVDGKTANTVRVNIK